MSGRRKMPIGLQEILAERARREEMLHASIQSLLGYNIARKASPGCPEHDPPYRFFADLYFGRVQRAIGMAPRGGGKTRIVSLLEWLTGCRTKTWMFHAGGVEEQARRAYSYCQEYIRLPAFAGLVSDSLMSETRWHNGSRLEIHSATLNQVAGAHPRLKVADEVEMWQSEVLEKFWGMGTGAGVQTVLISTRDRAVGLMQALLDEAPQRGLSIYHWCIWDVKEPCRPNCLRGACELWEECQGKHRDSTGHRPRLDVVDKFLSVTRDTWEAQFLCQRPGRQGLVFPDLVTEPGEPEQSNVTEAAEFDPALPVEVWCDDNIALPRAILLVQRDRLSRLRIWDEYYEAGRLQATSVQQVMARLAERGVPYPEVAVVPAEATALRIAWHQAEVDTASPRQYGRKEGAAVAAQFICSASRLRQLLIHPRCTNTIRSLRVAYRRELSPGVYDDEPAKHSDDHCQDAVLYGCWRYRFGD